MVIEEIESQFAANPVLSLRRLRELKTADFRSFVASAAIFLSTGKDGRMARLILHLIRENEAAFDQLLHGRHGNSEDLGSLLCCANTGVRHLFIPSDGLLITA